MATTQAFVTLDTLRRPDSALLAIRDLRDGARVEPARIRVDTPDDLFRLTSRRYPSRFLQWMSSGGSRTSSTTASPASTRSSPHAAHNEHCCALIARAASLVPSTGVARRPLFGESSSWSYDRRARLTLDGRRASAAGSVGTPQVAFRADLTLGIPARLVSPHASVHPGRTVVMVGIGATAGKVAWLDAVTCQRQPTADLHRSRP